VLNGQDPGHIAQGSVRAGPVLGSGTIDDRDNPAYVGAKAQPSDKRDVV
jgi:hypothetical protein